MEHIAKLDRIGCIENHARCGMKCAKEMSIATDNNGRQHTVVGEWLLWLDDGCTGVRNDDISRRKCCR